LHEDRDDQHDRGGHHDPDERHQDVQGPADALAVLDVATPPLPPLRVRVEPQILAAEGSGKRGGDPLPHAPVLPGGRNAHASMSPCREAEVGPGGGGHLQGVFTTAGGYVAIALTTCVTPC